MNKAHLLHDAFDVPARPEQDAPVPIGSVCALTGAPIRRGVEANSLLTRASSAPHEIFLVASAKYVSLESARCYKYFKGGLTGNLLAVGRNASPVGDSMPAGVRPMVSTDSAEDKERPCWQRVVYGTDPYFNLETGRQTLAIFTPEIKRRLWLDARLSTVGPHWQPHLDWGPHQRTLTVDFARLRQVLALCEYTYSLGFAKDNLLKGLFETPKMDLLREVGFARTRQLDEALTPYRNTDELLLSCFIVQRATSFNPQTNEGLDAPEDSQCLMPMSSPKPFPTTLKPTARTSSANPTPPPKTTSGSGSQTQLFS